MAERYKTKADYTILRKKHQWVEEGEVFENDFTTITPMDIYLPDGQNLITSDSNFKFSYRDYTGDRKKHSRSNWVKSPNGSDEWTLEDALSGGTVSDESKIRIKPNYNSIKDFAYFGSAIELFFQCTVLCCNRKYK